MLMPGVNAGDWWFLDSQANELPALLEFTIWLVRLVENSGCLQSFGGKYTRMGLEVYHASELTRGLMKTQIAGPPPHSLWGCT